MTRISREKSGEFKINHTPAGKVLLDPDLMKLARNEDIKIQYE